jgi:hypothetical protein
MTDLKYACAPVNDPKTMRRFIVSISAAATSRWLVLWPNRCPAARHLLAGEGHDKASEAVAGTRFLVAVIAFVFREPKMDCRKTEEQLRSRIAFENVGELLPERSRPSRQRVIS